jgi:hypothetical protein
MFDKVITEILPLAGMLLFRHDHYPIASLTVKQAGNFSNISSSCERRKYLCDDFVRANKGKWHQTRVENKFLFLFVLPP